MKESNQKKLIIKSNPHIKSAIRSAMLETFEKKDKKSWFSFSPWLVVTALSLVIVFSSIIGVSLTRHPLTVQSVSAEAIAALDEEQSQGKWQYLKTKEYTTYEDRTVVTNTEAWNNINFSYNSESNPEQFPNSQYKTTLEDGRILQEYATIDGKSYERDTRDVQKEILGYDPFEGFSSESATSYLPPGFSEAGLTDDDFMTMSMKQIDEKLIAAGQKPFNSPMYKSTDFPAYSMTPAEIEAYFKDNGDNYSQEVSEAIYGNEDNFVKPPMELTLADGTKLSESESEELMQKQTEVFETLDGLRTGKTSKKRELLEKISKDDDAKITTGIKWEGLDVISIELNNQLEELFGGSKNILYLDASTYRIVGEEYSFDSDVMSEVNIPNFEMPKLVKIVYIEEFYTNVEPKISSDGLVPTEELYDFSNTDESSTN